MKLVVLYQAMDPRTGQPGYYDGFQRLVAEGVLTEHRALGYLGVAQQRGWDALWAEAAELSRDADAIFLQFFHAPMPDLSAGIRRLCELPQRPLLFTSLGDPFGRWDHRVPQSMRAASAASAVTFLTGMGYVAGQLARAGGHNLVLMPNGCCQVRFAAEPPSDVEPPEFDVCFIGNRLRARNPLGHYFRTARRRVEFVSAFTRRYGSRFALFGHGWDGNPSWLGPVPYDSQHAAYRRAAVIAGGTPNGEHDYYTSDRLFIALASGVPVVDWAVPGVDRLLENGRDCWLARGIPEMMRECDRLLERSGEERRRLAMATRERIMSAHTQYHRCRQMIDIVFQLREARRRGAHAPVPELPFLPAGQNPTEPPRAVVAWQG